MCFHDAWRLQLFDQAGNHAFWHWMISLSVLFEDRLQRRFHVNDFNSSIVVGKQINPALARQARRVRRIEGAVSVCRQMFATLFARGLDHFALIVGRIHVESRARSPSIATRTNDFKNQRRGDLGLKVVQRHEPRHFQFFHRGEMKPVECSAVNRLRMPVLAQRR